jgi:limonene-1,2-epoxide hydrolase
VETAVRAFFAAMNAQDADAAVALTREDVTIVLGPHELVGHEALRALALQRDPAVAFETVPLEIHAPSATVAEVRARRIQRWRETGAVAAEEELRASVTFDPGGAIVRVELTPA